MKAIIGRRTHFRQLDQECRLASHNSVTGPDPSKDAVRWPDLALSSWDKGAHLSHHDGHTRLSQERGLATHVRTGDNTCPGCAFVLISCSFNNVREVSFKSYNHRTCDNGEPVFPRTMSLCTKQEPSLDPRQGCRLSLSTSCASSFLSVLSRMTGLHTGPSPLSSAV